MLINTKVFIEALFLVVKQQQQQLNNNTYL